MIRVVEVQENRRLDTDEVFCSIVIELPGGRCITERVSREEYLAFSSQGSAEPMLEPESADAAAGVMLPEDYVDWTTIGLPSSLADELHAQGVPTQLPTRNLVQILEAFKAGASPAQPAPPAHPVFERYQGVPSRTVPKDSMGNPIVPRRSDMGALGELMSEDDVEDA